MTWTSQFGTANSELATGVAADGSGIVVGGSIESGSFDGQTSSGSADAFIRMLDNDGAELWTSQFGTTAFDRLFGVGSDLSGIYAAGSTPGEFDGQSRVGGYDGFLAKFDYDGQLLWVRQFGTQYDEDAFAVAVHATGIYVVGMTIGQLPGQTSMGHFDAYIMKFDADGNMVWTRQFGSTSLDRANGVSADDSGVYIAGSAARPLPDQQHSGSHDAFIRKYDFEGNEMWTRQFGTPLADEAFGISAHHSGVYMVGRTRGGIDPYNNNGLNDAFIRKYDMDGNEMWTDQFGTSGTDEARCVAVNETNVYIGGSTDATLPGQESLGDMDAFVYTLDLFGSLLWAKQYGSATFEDALAITADDSGARVAGYTWGALPGQTNSGGRDAYLVHFGMPDEPAPVDIVSIDIKPKHCPNQLKVKKKKDNDDGKVKAKLKVALAGTETLDVRNVDVLSVRLEGVQPHSWYFKDVTRPVDNTDDCNCVPRKKDKFTDVEMKFDEQAVIAQLGPVMDGEMRTLTLRGNMLDGTPFEATDCVIIKNKYEAVLYPAAPNPFNPVTRITFDLPIEAHVTLSVYDVAGRLVDQLVDEVRPSGLHDVYWSAEGKASGAYFYRLKMGDDIKTKRVILLK